MNLQDSRDMLKLIETTTEYMQGKDIPAMPPIFMGRGVNYTLCPELWFWTYGKGAVEAYPEVVIVSHTPFWTKGQAEIDMMCKADRLKRMITMYEKGGSNEDYN